MIAKTRSGFNAAGLNYNLKYSFYLVLFNYYLWIGHIGYMPMYCNWPLKLSVSYHACQPPITFQDTPTYCLP